MTDTPNPQALLEAVTRSDIAMVRLLLDQGVDITTTNGAGQTALHLASKRFANRDIFNLLIERHAPLNVQDSEGRTPLHYALITPDDNIVSARTLIAKGALLDIADDEGNTPLHIAAREGHQEIAGTLLVRGADLTLRNDMDQTAEDLALEKIDAPGMTGALRQNIVADIRHHAESRRRAEENREKAARQVAQAQHETLRRHAPTFRLRPHG